MKHDPGILADRLEGPDFIIGGAPKCGTTSLHFILDQHPQIALPTEEVNYFDADDPLSWPDFFHLEKGELNWLAPDARRPRTRDWYCGLFADLGDGTLRGEDSTRYLFSPMAPARVAQALPKTKMIFMLRDPVKRAWSQYWHEVKMMRATVGFEAALTQMPVLVNGSTYAPHLKAWRDALGPDRIKVVLMEDFLADMQTEMDAIADFLGLARFDLAGYDRWFNRTYYPIWTRAQLAMNAMAGRHIARMRYRTHMRSDWTARDHLRNKIYQKWFHKVNPLLLRATTAPMMKPRTRDFLSAHLSARNAGLDDMLGRDLSEVWPNWRRRANATHDLSRDSSSTVD